jgi:hypothetical protein
MQPQYYNQPMKTPGNPTGKEDMIDEKKITGIVIGAIVAVVAVAAGIVGIMKLINKADEPEPTAAPTATAEPEPEPTVPEKIDLQLALNQWVTSQPAAANSGVLIYDIDNDEVVARHNEDVAFRIESIYKMFVAYEGYYRVDKGQWDGTKTVFNWGDYQNRPYTINLCLDHMIRFSFSSCAEALWSWIGHDNLQAAYNEKGFKNTSIQGLTSTPSDLTKLYQQFWNHNDLSENSWKKIKDSMLNQTAPASAGYNYARNWRQGLPSGFNTAVVYDKVGWLGDGNGNWTYYDDAAFLVFPEVEKNKDGEKKLERHYIMIALTKNTSPKELVKLGRKIEDAVKTADNY